MSNTYKRATFGIGPFIGGFQNTMHEKSLILREDGWSSSLFQINFLVLTDWESYFKKKNVYVPDYIKYGILLKTAKKLLKEVICGVK